MASCGLIGFNGVLMYATYYPGTEHHVLLTDTGCRVRLLGQYAGMSLMLTAVWRKTRYVRKGWGGGFDACTPPPATSFCSLSLAQTRYHGRHRHRHHTRTSHPAFTPPACCTK